MTLTLVLIDMALLLCAVMIINRLYRQISNPDKVAKAITIAFLIIGIIIVVFCVFVLFYAVLSPTYEIAPPPRLA